MSERINKYLSAHGVCSRREADRMIQEGRITVDGRIADMGEMVEDNTIICVDGRKIDSSTPPQVVIALISLLELYVPQLINRGRIT